MVAKNQRQLVMRADRKADQVLPDSVANTMLDCCPAILDCFQ
jgi:hypothetical protein